MESKEETVSRLKMGTGIPPTWPLDHFQTPSENGHSSADAAELAHGHNVDNTF